ncbi:MAG: hypothetical protein IH595_13795 [Bacteroidales bacterium]|nr:hypothetical protein [Bacteroidales bacterium]
MDFKRSFTVSDSKFFEYADTVMAILPADLPDFTAFDPIFTGDYVNQIKLASDNARAVPPDEIIVDQLGGKTQKVKTALTDCYNDYQTIAYFAGRAFKGNVSVQNEFGKNDIRKARNSQPKMIIFMDLLITTVAKYSAELLQAGCSQELMDGLAAKADVLRNANSGQEGFKKGRGVSTQNRIQLMNSLYELLKPLNEAANIIFRDNPAKMKIYTMPKRARKSGSTPEAPAEGV